MTGVCPLCGARYPLSGARGARVSAATCPRDGSALVGPRAGACTVRGRYESPGLLGETRFYTGDCGQPRGHEGACRTSSGHPLRAAPSAGLTISARAEGGFAVFADTVLIGSISPVDLSSHIRPSRAKSAPFWAAVASDGGDEGRHQRRADALAALAWVNLGRPAGGPSRKPAQGDPDDQ